MALHGRPRWGGGWEGALGTVGDGWEAVVE